MKFHMEFPIEPLDPPLGYGQSILLMGSCFAERIGELLGKYKFSPLVNPNGILFNPESMVTALEGYLDDRQYEINELFHYGGLWHSWDHHGRFSGPDPEACLASINALQRSASERLRTASWIILSFGSAHAYRLAGEERIVANCHKMPATGFEKIRLQPARVIALLDHFLFRLFQLNPGARVIFTVSPVRYVKDGLIQSNLSKAILLSAVHHLVDKFDRLYYFPSYELVVDDLRDYRFYEPDLVHPNGAAIAYVWEKLVGYAMAPDTRQLLEEVGDIVRAAEHAPLNPGSPAYREFCRAQLERIRLLEARFPFLNFTAEKSRFAS